MLEATHSVVVLLWMDRSRQALCEAPAPSQWESLRSVDVLLLVDRGTKRALAEAEVEPPIQAQALAKAEVELPTRRQAWEESEVEMPIQAQALEESEDELPIQAQDEVELSIQALMAVDYSAVEEGDIALQTMPQSLPPPWSLPECKLSALCRTPALGQEDALGKLASGLLWVTLGLGHNLQKQWQPVQLAAATGATAELALLRAVSQ